MEKSALLITYKHSMTLGRLTFLKKATTYLHSKDLPFSTLLTFDHTKDGYRGIWSYCTGKSVPRWDVPHYKAMGSFLGKMHRAAIHYKEGSLQGLPIILSLKEDYARLKDSLPESFYPIANLIEAIEEKWPLFLSTGLVHTDLYPSNVLFRREKVSGIVQNHHMKIDILLYDLASIAKHLYFSEEKDQKEKEEAFFSSYTSLYPLSEEEILAIPVLTAAKLLQKTFHLMDKHLKDTAYKETYLNSAAIALIHAEKALHLYG